MLPGLIIDPGHGGSDSGAADKLLLEKDLTLKISKYQAARFKQLGIHAPLTRDSDITLDPASRARIVKNYGVPLCISNHINAGGGTGAEVWASIHSDKKWANLVMQELTKTGIKSRGVKTKESTKVKGQDYYFMHRDTGAVQTLIVEYGFIDSADAEFIQHNWQDLAEAAVKATCDYLGAKYTKPVGTDPLSQAVDVLVKAGIITSPGYWLTNAKAGCQCNGEYVASLILKTAEKLKSK